MDKTYRVSLKDPDRGVLVVAADQVVLTATDVVFYRSVPAELVAAVERSAFLSLVRVEEPS